MIQCKKKRINKMIRITIKKKSKVFLCRCLKEYQILKNVPKYINCNGNIICKVQCQNDI